ncbi:MAG: hypothetical protein J6U85_05525 [Bacteroidales bacterium]|nr:hypothetical protein [Bacteroidales bacterium]
MITIEIIEERLKKIGKKSFVCHLYPELKKNIDVTIEDIASKYSEFGTYAKSAQRTRLSNARYIFKNGAEKEALLCIINSKNVDKYSLKQAQEYINSFNNK